ncbi:AAA family ATPase [Rhodococcus sp. IEGM 1408]|uniref:AAA family ATPase n=1 Tax=Rhodococcus sp. IEGM 1408 TaxID=3082220 RepID=UPI002954DF6C|nr:AAA family ATPase [Rhodococcus sp. IEGM 1408]MDV8003172.1 AAA family ATPase [Rhodococcus sp. IEGM 1408]
MNPDFDAYLATVHEFPTAPARPSLASRIVDRAGLARLPQPTPFIADTLDRGTVAMLAGSWGSAKSFVALDWCACIATGKPWQGRTVDRGRVLYVAAEGAQGISVRLDSWEAAWGTKVPSERFSVLPGSVNLTQSQSVEELAAHVEAEGFAVVVIDTLARNAAGAEENSARDMGIVVDSAYRLLAATPSGRGIVIIVHHAGKNGTVRGSSALEAGCDTVYQTAKDGAAVTLKRTKRKDGPPEDRHDLTLSDVPGTKSATLGVHRVRQDADMAGRARELLSVFVSVFASTGASKADLRDAADMPSATFSRSLNTLVGNGSLVNVGSDMRPFYKLPPAA